MKVQLAARTEVPLAKTTESHGGSVVMMAERADCLPAMGHQAPGLSVSMVVAGRARGVDVYQQIADFAKLEELSSLLGVSERA